MKKFLLIAMALVATFTAKADTKTYTDGLIVTINDESTDPIETTVNVETNEDGTINFILKNFCLGEDIKVGNIEVDNLEVGQAARYGTFLYKGKIDIAPGDLDGVAEDEYLGPMISPVPVYIKGKINDEKAYLTIDIDMMETLEQIIYVSFGTDFPALAVESTNYYNENLIVTINEESSDPIAANVTVETLENGSINFILKNFQLSEDINVGNILVEELPLTIGEGFDTFSFKGRIDITPGNIDGVAEETYLGPFISPVPVDIKGKIRGEKVYLTIDIDMMDMLGQIIYVSFSQDFYSVIYKANNEVVGVQNVTVGDKIPGFTYTPDSRYTFNGWSSEDGETYTTMPDHNVVYVADLTDGISQIVNAKDANKALYDLAGRRVTNATKGIYIVNGKKIMINK